MTEDTAKRPLRKLLYLEDDLVIAELVRMAIDMRPGIAIEHHTSGPAAVSAYERFKPDLMLFDVMIPDMNGIEVYRRIRDNHGPLDAPLIVMTAKSRANEESLYRSEGAAALIEKPFDALTLSDRIHDIYSQSLGEA